MRRLALIMMSFILTAGASAGEAVRFYVNDETRRDIVTFTSKAPLETVVGKTGEISGFIEVDIDDLSETPKAKFEVDLASVKTGIGMRDTHMREQYLETDKFPKAVFTLTGIKTGDTDKLENNQPVDLTLEGDFTVHGVTKKVEVFVTATFMKESEETKVRLPGDLLHIVGTFDVYLTQHNIKRPKFVILKLDDLQRIDLDFFASTASSPVSMADREDK